MRVYRWIRQKLSEMEIAKGDWEIYLIRDAKGGRRKTP
jgi:hypothetical protein